MAVKSYDVVTINSDGHWEMYTEDSNGSSASNASVADSISSPVSGNLTVGTDYTAGGRTNTWRVYRIVYRFLNTLRAKGTIEIHNGSVSTPHVVLSVDTMAAPDDASGDRDVVSAALIPDPVSNVSMWDDYGANTIGNTIYGRGYPVGEEFDFTTSSSVEEFENAINAGVTDYIGIMLIHRQDFDCDFDSSNTLDSADTRCYFPLYNAISGYPKLRIHYRVAPLMISMWA